MSTDLDKYRLALAHLDRALALSEDMDFAKFIQTGILSAKYELQRQLRNAELANVN